MTDVSTCSSLMIRAQLIYKNSSGVYTYLPEGVEILHRIIRLCRKNMLEIGCKEILMPALQRCELLEISGRSQVFGDIIFYPGQKYYLAPTHEEPVVKMFKYLFEAQGKSSRLLPAHFIQWQTKFRNELRPRGGLLRGKEFWMQDSYSFHDNDTCLDHTYFKVRAIYRDIFEQLELPYIEAQASTGDMGGSESLEFHFLHPSGEDRILWNKNGAYNQEIAPSYSYAPSSSIHYFEESSEDVPRAKIINHQGSVFVILEEDAIAWPKIAQIEEKGSYVDYKVARLVKFSCSLGTGSWHNFKPSKICDIRVTQDQDLDLHGDPYRMSAGIEIGHIFKLNTAYTSSFSLNDQEGKPLLMGCYGIGISRLLACIILKHSQEDRLVLPKTLSQKTFAILTPLQNQDLAQNLEGWMRQYKQDYRTLCYELSQHKSESIRAYYEDLRLKGIKFMMILRERYCTLLNLDNDGETKISLNFEDIVSYLEELP